MYRNPQFSEATMTPDPHDVQELDFQIMGAVEGDTITRASRSWKWKVRGFGFLWEMEWKKTTVEIGTSVLPREKE